MILFRIAPGGCCERVWVCRVPEASRLHVPGVWSLSLQLHCWERRWDRHPLWEHQPRQHGCRLEGRVQKKIFSVKMWPGGESQNWSYFIFLNSSLRQADGVKIANLTIVNCNMERLYGDIFRTSEIVKMIIEDTPIRLVGRHSSQF